MELVQLLGRAGQMGPSPPFPIVPRKLQNFNLSFSRVEKLQNGTFATSGRGRAGNGTFATSERGRAGQMGPSPPFPIVPRKMQNFNFELVKG